LDGFDVKGEKSLKYGWADLKTQIFNKLSWPPVAKRLPSGENLY
jgi:hypothetical protein